MHETFFVERLNTLTQAGNRVARGREGRFWIEKDAVGGADIPPCGTVKKPGRAMDRTR